MDSELAHDLAIETLTRQFAAEMAQRTQAVLSRAEAEIHRLQEALQLESQLRQQAEQQLRQRTEQLQSLEEALQGERQARAQAEGEVAAIHAAIAAQLECCEQDQASQEAAEAERLRQLEVLRQELSRERQRRQLLEGRIETLRLAVADLFNLDAALPLPAGLESHAPGPAVVIHA